MSHRVKVALVVPKGWSYGRYVARGVAEFARASRKWRFHLAEPTLAHADTIIDWQPDGIIALLSHDDLIDALTGMRCPLVNISNRLSLPEIPRVGVDDIATGARAAEYLLGLGLANFGYFSLTATVYSNQRMLGFVQTLRVQGCECSNYQQVYSQPEGGGSQDGWVIGEESMRNWLESLPKPVGILASNDYEGRLLTEVAEQAEIHVPRDAAILGVDNDEFECELCDPTLSSVMLPARHVGRMAAEVLEKLIAGEPAPVEPVLLQPGEVVVRASTDRHG